ncbi:SDR family NAD(P)-dependent oxidoreductase [Nocardia puris]|uniref:type I polyketide synthase n=1 Tax=Nocardia puris TaxID=208602 RepID=UPI0018940B16|nr:type I polyketide synthase [Nocardia puris]MBF6213588.1 SDR family NAD(P)-dependent oxidoreductase [Nocardia puris]MBF6365482.1 SDR family NAD(P)-dependent oxidoreductase [Nocardia puris]MBF6459948.1 SDR family NAD(P)-dependent oxidoreductase [Nocardia puris]
MTTPEPPPVAIVGMACRVPGAAGLDAYWRLLLDGRDATGDPPPNRPLTRRAGYLDDVEWFDNEWFAVSAREAAAMDPQQRLAMEVAVEAVDDAGIGYRTKGSDAAVVFGACGYDHGIATLSGGERDAPYAVTGSALSIIANRLSYALDLHGPSLVVDSACSSSLAAVDLALRLLADGTVPFALVGGVNLTLLPHTSDYLARSGFLAPDGRCKPFDATADGYTRSDGCGVIVLQRTEDAQREGNRIYAEILGAAVGSDGRSNGLYAPNGRAQSRTVLDAWSRAGLEPGAAGYLECHGTGTSLGDAVEVGALASVLPEDSGVWIGSVKSNLGHLEAAAGVAGLIKTALSVYHGVIAPTIHFETPNPLLKLEERGLRVPTGPVDWSAVPPELRLAGVSSFGFGGTNAHVVLRGYAERALDQEESPVVLAVTGRDVGALRENARELAARLDPVRVGVGRADEPDPARNPLSPPARAARSERSPAFAQASGDDPPTALRSFAVATARVIPENARAAVVAGSADEAVSGLLALAEDSPSNAVFGPVTRRRRGGVLFLFSGQGGQHARMGRALAARYPVFAGALAEVSDAIAAQGGPRVWTPRRGFGLGAGAATEQVQPALFAYQVALARLLDSWGVRPDAVAGHSLGEVAAAAVSGALSTAEAARVAVVRSRVLARLDGRGAMALLESTPEEADRLVAPMREHVAVAAVNGPRAVVVSGTPRYIDTLVRRASRRGLFARRIAVDFAAHSPQVGEVLPELTAGLEGLTPAAPWVPVYSTARRGAVLDSAAMDAEYWADNVSGTVELAAALDSAAADGLGTVLELSPQPVLTPAAREHPDFRESAYPVAARTDEAAALLDCLAHLYIEGRAVNWAVHGRFDGPAVRRHWRRHRFPLLGIEEPGAPHLPYRAEPLDDHVVQGIPTVPAVHWVRRLLHTAHRGGAGTLADFFVHERTDLAALPTVVHRLDGASVRAETTDGTVLAAARPGPSPTPADIVAWMRAVDANRAARHRMREISGTDFYAALHDRGLEYGPRFRPLTHLFATTDAALADLEAAELHSAAPLDGCLHLLAAAAGDLPGDALPLPIAMDTAWISTEPGHTLHQAHAILRTRSPHGVTADVIGTDQHGAPALAFLGVQVRFVDGGRIAKRIERRDTTSGTVAYHEPATGTAPQSGTARSKAIPGTGPHTGTAPTAPPIATAPRHERTPGAAPGTSTGQRPGLSPNATPYTGTAPRAGLAPNTSPLLDITPSAAAAHADTSPQVGATPSTTPEATHPASPFYTEAWTPVPTDAETQQSTLVGHGRSAPSVPKRGLVVGESRPAREIARALERTLPTERLARDPDSATAVFESVLLGRPASERTALVVVWPEEQDGRTPVARVLELLQRARARPIIESITVVLPESALRGGVVAQGIAGLTRTLQLESGRHVRLVWSDEDARSTALLTELIVRGNAPAGEVRLRAGTCAVRRFVPVPPDAEPIEIDPAGTYVVTGGLGALGAVAVRWLLDSGARDVVVFTRSPRPVPPLLDGFEDRMVVVRCDVADRSDLDNALEDIRECGSTLRGIVHAAGALEDAAFDTVDAGQLARMFAPKPAAAADLLALTATDPLDFVFLFSSATGAFGAPGQAAYAAANAAMDAIAHTPHKGVITSIGWGAWASGLAESAGGATHLRRAGLTPFDPDRGSALLTEVSRYRLPYLLALDYTPTDDSSPVAARLREMLSPTEPQPVAPIPPQPSTGNSRSEAGSGRPTGDVADAVRRVLAATLELTSERIGPDDDFNDLGLSSLLAIEVRRGLEERLGIVLSTAEVFKYPTVAALAAALTDRVAARDER